MNDAAPGSTSIRVQPVQTRSQNRLNSLRESAKAVIERVGVERFTTADIAQEAGASIGTVYRYYPDRIAVLDDIYPNRVVVLETPLGGPAIEQFQAAVESAYASLTDVSLQNPRDRVRQARAALTPVVKEPVD